MPFTGKAGSLIDSSRNLSDGLRYHALSMNIRA